MTNGIRTASDDISELFRNLCWKFLSKGGHARDSSPTVGEQPANAMREAGFEEEGGGGPVYASFVVLLKTLRDNPVR